MKYLVLGTDARQKYLNELLCAKGHTAVRKPQEGFDAILLPVSETKKYEPFAAALFVHAKRGCRIYGCHFSKQFLANCKENGISCVDYMQREKAARANAVATAEGIIAEAVSLSPVTIAGSMTIVVGYGKCGKVLAGKLRSLDARVIILEQNRECKEEAAQAGFSAYLQEDCKAGFFCAGAFDYVFNTAPENGVPRELVMQLPAHAAVLDLASAPGGVDFEACAQRNLVAKLCPGLPARYAPYSGAKLLFEVVNGDCE